MIGEPWGKPPEPWMPGVPPTIRPFADKALASTQELLCRLLKAIASSRYPDILAPGSECFDIVETAILTTVLGQQLVSSNAQRTFLAFAQGTMQFHIITTHPAGAAAYGLSLPTGGGILSFTRKDNPGLCCSAWYSGTNEPAQMTVIEEIYRPERDRRR